MPDMWKWVRCSSLPCSRHSRRTQLPLRKTLCSTARCWDLLDSHTAFCNPPASRPLEMLSTLLHTESSWWHTRLYAWPWDCKSRVNCVKGKRRQGYQMGHVKHGEKTSLGMPRALKYRRKQFAAVMMGAVKGLSTERMLFWKWMEKSGRGSSCCESRCETGCEMLL